MAPQPTERHAPTDAELLALVTHNGEPPLEEVALVGGLIFDYVRGLDAWLPIAIEDNREAELCKNYLRRIGREFASRRDLPRM